MLPYFLNYIVDMYFLNKPNMEQDVLLISNSNIIDMYNDNT